MATRTRKTSNSLEKAWAEGGEIEVTKAAIVKYAQVIDVSNAGRDMKPLMSGMFEAIDRLKALESAIGGDEKTPLFAIIKAAEEQRKAI